MREKERVEYLDYAKAISIFIVLMCHRLLLKVHILGFAMPAFFIISGYTSKTEIDLRSYVLKKAKTVLVPYWTACAVYSIIDVIRAYAFGYSNWLIIFPGLGSLVYGSSYNIPVIGEFGKFIKESNINGNLNTPWLMNIMTPLNCHLWFLPVLFSGSIIFAIIMRYRKWGLLTDFLLIVVLILAGAIELIPGMIQLPYGIARGFVASAYILIGRIIKERDIFNKGSVVQKVCISIPAAAIGIFLGTKGYMNGTWNMSYYGDGGVWGLYISFIAGLFLVYAGVMLCRMICCSPFEKLKYVLGVIGRNTLPTYLWHFVIYFVADLFAVYVIGWQTTPEPYLMEMFDGAHLLYRWVVLFVTWTLLIIWGEYRRNRCGKRITK